jgi:hypothetical protein
MTCLALACTVEFAGIAVAQEYQQYRPPPSDVGNPTEAAASGSGTIDPLFSTEVDAHGRSTTDAQLNSVKQVISHLTITSGSITVPGVRYRSFDQLHVDGSVGYPMKDILVPYDTEKGAPALDLHKLNMKVPSLRKRTSYKKGERKYLENYQSTLLEIDRGFVYSFGDDIVVADSSRVFVMGGCGDNMAGWALASSDTGQYQEWDSPDLNKDGFHRFSSLAVLVQRLGRSYFHWLTSTLPRLVHYLDHLRDEPAALSRLRYLVYDEPYVIDVLQLLGVDIQRQIIFFDTNSVYSAEILYVTSSTPCGQPPRSVLLNTKMRVYNSLYPMPGPGAPPNVLLRNERRLKYANRRGLIIYVSDIKIINQDEIINTIREKYIVPYQKKFAKSIELVIVNGNNKLKESTLNGNRPQKNVVGQSRGGGNGQIVGTMSSKRTMLAEYSLWRRAELIIGSTTSELLTNMLWCQNETRIVELMPILPMSKGRRATLTYADMAGSLDLIYSLVPMEIQSIGSNMSVPIHTFENALTLVGM